MAGRCGRRADATTAALISTLYCLACLRWLVQCQLQRRIGARRGGAGVRCGMARGVGICIASPMTDRYVQVRHCSASRGTAVRSRPFLYARACGSACVG
jgi:hypothetical protein